MAQYCVFTSVAQYGQRDEIVGSRSHREKCFKSIRAAKKYAKKLAERDDYDLYTSICRGARMCRPGQEVRFRKSKWARSCAARCTTNRLRQKQGRDGRSEVSCGGRPSRTARPLPVRLRRAQKPCLLHH